MRFCDQWCVVDVKEKSTEWYLCESGESQKIIFWKLPENSFLMDEISEDTRNEELNKIFFVKKKEIQIFGTTNLEFALFDAQREMESEKTIIVESQSMRRSSSTWESTFEWQIGDEGPSS